MRDFTDLVDLASLRLRGAVLAASDEFFAEKENLLKPADAVFLPHEYTDRGKWMDGWESRRKRVQGHDWAIVRLGVPGVVRGVVVDTAFFRGNFPAECSIEACAAPTDALPSVLADPSTEWTEILARSELKGDHKNAFAIECPYAFTHVRLNIFPDGGVARLRVYGEAVPDWARIGHARGEVDVANVEHGGHVLACSDMFFGERRNLIMPDRALNMGDGWETRRRRGPGFDWAIVQLGVPVGISRVVVDTHHFKGNYPDTCRIEACASEGASVEQLTRADHPWREVLARTKLQADTRHLFEDAIAVAAAAVGRATHVRLSVYPDGGVSRLRVFGTIDAHTRRALGLRRLNALVPADAARALRGCCAASAWVQAMVAARPFESEAAVMAAADATWARAGAGDWHEAFRAHPRIGEEKAASEQSGQARAWSAGEQAGVSEAGGATRAALAEANRAYEAKFGWIYIVCASGKSADEMLAIARGRMANAAGDELKVAAGEQHKITRLRLEKLLEP